MEIFIIHNLKVGDRKEKKSYGQPLYAVMPLLHNTFWHFLAPQGGPLGGPTQLLTLIFQLSQFRGVVWKNIFKISTG
jgi:hypothetical protein